MRDDHLILPCGCGAGCMIIEFDPWVEGTIYECDIGIFIRPRQYNLSYRLGKIWRLLCGKEDPIHDMMLEYDQIIKLRDWMNKTFPQEKFFREEGN